jgi:hypothetical protein
MAVVRTDVWEGYISSIIRVRRVGELGTTLAVTNNRRTLACLSNVIQALCEGHEMLKHFKSGLYKVLVAFLNFKLAYNMHKMCKLLFPDVEIRRFPGYLTNLYSCKKYPQTRGKIYLKDQCIIRKAYFTVTAEKETIHRVARNIRNRPHSVKFIVSSSDCMYLKLQEDPSQNWNHPFATSCNEHI